MEENLILEGLLSMVTELKEKQEAQVTPASREETLERLNAIEQALSELHSNPAILEKDLQAIRSQLDDIRNGMQGQQKHIEDTAEVAGKSADQKSDQHRDNDGYRAHRHGDASSVHQAG